MDFVSLIWYNRLAGGKMKAVKNKKWIKILILVVLLVGLVFLGVMGYEKVQEYRFKKMLQDNDANNYELTEIINEQETKVYVRDKILMMKDGNTRTWVSEFQAERIIFDEEYRTAILDKNDEELKVNSLNYTYIHDFFENGDQVFKYLGEEDGYYKLQFKEKGSKKITLLYLNKETKIVEKMVQNAGNFEFVTKFQVEKNAVSKEEVELPDLEGYRAYESVNSR